MVRLICPNLKCRTILCVPEHVRGKMVKCSACGMKVRIPDVTKPEQPAGAPPEEGKTSGK